MTQLLYQNDSYMKEADATVKEVNGRFIVLDKSIFIPATGGLPNDEGVLKKENEVYKVVYAIKKDNNISLEVDREEVDKEGLKENDKVFCRLDWKRRYKIMQYHTATHALSSVIHNKTGALITGNQISLDKARIDFSLDDYNPERIKDFIKEANERLKTNQDVTIYFLTREEALKKPELARLAKGLIENIQEIRVVNIGDIDEQADGGPHVKNTSEVPELELLKTENKGKNNRRLYFKLKE